jgi:hypothetical protein
MVEHISSVEPEIEDASGERMVEIKTKLRFAQRRQSPFGTMMGVYIEDGFLAVIEMSAEVEEGVRVTERAADVAIVRWRRFEAGRLREQGMEGGFGLHFNRIVGVLYCSRFDGRFYNRRFGGHLAGRLNDGLEIALDSDRAVEDAIVLSGYRGN